MVGNHYLLILHSNSLTVLRSWLTANSNVLYFFRLLMLYISKAAIAHNNNTKIIVEQHLI